ncbi:MAG: hypothetical protein HYW79_02725 [Parcubacteria group bacterium]|nr:hypothetical protein [Parcubacteria group bacterium]
MPRICIWGDSITWGSYDLEKGGWVERLKVDLINGTEGEVQVYNLGVSGDKVADVLKRFEAEASARQPDVVILAIGINDSPHENYSQGTNLKEFEGLYRKLMNIAKRYSERLVMVSPTNVDDSRPDNTYRGVDRYAGVVESLAKEDSVPFINLFGLMSKEDLEVDGLHPSATGHEKIYRAVKNELEKNNLI